MAMRRSASILPIPRFIVTLLTVEFRGLAAEFTETSSLKLLQMCIEVNSGACPRFISSIVTA